MAASSSRSERLRTSRERVARAKREGEEYGLLTLNTILRNIGQVRVTVELRDDTVLTGTLQESDAYMNISLSDAERRAPDGSSVQTDAMHIKGAAIRCVHLPADIDCEKLMRLRIKAVDQGARSFSQRKPKAATERPANLAPIVGTVISEADADVD